MMGLGENSNIVYLIDFGLAKKYKKSKSNVHNGVKDVKIVAGTSRYASINALRGLGKFTLYLEQCRKDDLEAIGYVLIYFLKGSLPWQGIDIENARDSNKKILELKKNTPLNVLVEGLPSIKKL